MQKDVIEKLVKEMLDSGVIQNSNSQNSSFMVLVKKKYGTWKKCIDYQAFNQVTINDRYHIPLIEKLLDELGKAMIFYKIDLHSGY